MKKQPKNMNVSSFTFRHLKLDDIPSIVQAFQQIGWNKPATLYQQYLKDQEDGRRLVWVALMGETFTGYVTLKRTSGYEPFRKGGISEISDLNVLPRFQRQGVASFLLDLAEAEAFKKSESVGIGVGLSADYGKAQILYVQRGYIPNGQGISSHYKTVPYGSSVVLDDDLVLWLLKRKAPK